MIQSVSKYMVSDILSPSKDHRYIIPKYQREYTWNKKDWENLFEDIDGSMGDHFLGSIICVNKQEYALHEPELEVIDGQQRLTTLSLLYAAIFAKLSKEKLVDENAITEKQNLKYRLLCKKDPSKTKISLSTQSHNNEDYLEVLEEASILKMVSGKPKNFGNRRLYKAYSYFISRLEQLSYDALLEFLDKINSALLVQIEVLTHSDAFTLFESINNRGIDLSAIDLIKNNLLAILEKEHKINVEDSFNSWSAIIENLGDDSSLQERFLRHYYNAFRYKDEIKVVKIKSSNKATKSNLIKIYEALIKKNPSVILEEFSKKSQIYHSLVFPSEEDYCFEPLVDLSHIGGAPSYSFLLLLTLFIFRTRN